MKKYFLLGLTAFALLAVAPSESKADDGFRVYVNPGYQQDRPTTTTGVGIATIARQMKIGGIAGTGTIIGTITIETMIAIEAVWLFQARSNPY